MNPSRGPFLECRSINGHFSGCYGNCKWRDYAARCTLTFVPANNDGDRDLDLGVDNNDRDCIRLVKLKANDEGSRLLSGARVLGLGL